MFVVFKTMVICSKVKVTLKVKVLQHIKYLQFELGFFGPYSVGNLNDTVLWEILYEFIGFPDFQIFVNIAKS